jgi:predicted nuclease with TOPRIM domain
VTRSIEQGNEQTAANGRAIESLEKQLQIVRSRTEKLTGEKAALDKESHRLDQTLRDLKARLEIANETNAKFHASVPLEVSNAFEEEAKSSEKRV